MGCPCLFVFIFSRQQRNFRAKTARVGREKLPPAANRQCLSLQAAATKTAVKFDLVRAGRNVLQHTSDIPNPFYNEPLDIPNDFIW